MGRFPAAPRPACCLFDLESSGGQRPAPASEIWAILHGGGDLTERRILLNIRLPRLLAAMILGGALSVSGFLLQTFFHNPIA
ncbi:MAG: iron chelate uptake ABC transporter family permease subunit, partial [Oscillospiraceae bacterium]